ncbi:MAG: hypothetical protein O7H41_10725 [Planctomycetota bacterium]|nr:hypothetical protein [Planctomycetota bacterium]
MAKKKKPLDVDLVIREICREDPRYPAGAYHFIREALDFTQSMKRKPGHVRGQDLLEGIRCLALEQFGPMALSVFKAWRVYRTEDIGEMVFNMVRGEILGKTDEDSMEDFVGGYSFEEAFGRAPAIDKDFRL